MRATLFSVPELPAGKVSIMARPRGGDWLIDEVRALVDAQVDIVVSLLTIQEEQELDLLEEEKYCEQEGIVFFSFPILDRSIPALTESTANFLKGLSVQLADGKHIVLHCRQGLGRSALMAAALLVLAGCDADEACELLSKARGYMVPETKEQKEWIMAFAQHIRHNGSR
jgi:protein-tyrosine phosphatase